ncbi:MBOAT family O-acyltransferase [Cohnella candidum]|uniref:MBOAT family protein n=1 Tax=Cohnella candidum TaxID=2674991 RepID=A0A3G3K0V0_9BACL|nr:MBOAT family O-acyltransferase [Cohnella candidum]AYQ74175.1 MBOAT family protein [Cohnella candidum]
MFFYSPNFMIFFIILLIPYLLLRKQRVWLLAAANAIFYVAHPEGFLVLFFVMAFLTFGIVHTMQLSRFRWLFWIGIVLNVLNLAFFKYTLFVLGNLDMLGLHLPRADDWAASIVLPLGISFYTFEFISYLIDVRRGDSKPTRSFVKFWVFVSMFPHLIAGPIMRGDELFPQLDELSKKRITWSDIRYGVYLFAIGMVKKIVIADQLSPIVKELFDKGSALTSTESWMAAYTFSFYIYNDFSAYTDMAIGLGIMMGVRFADNFNSPYLSANPSEFWRRWHMTLSRWIRDYIYIGLGGNRKGQLRLYANLLIAMLISGLWHGAMWTFVIWGGIHGLLQVIHRLSFELNRFRWVAVLRDSVVYRIVAIFVFFHIVTWTWVFFHAPSLSMAWDMTVKMLRVHAADLIRHPTFPLIVGLFAVHVVEYVLRKNEGRFGRIWHFVPFPLRSAAYALITFTLIYYLQGGKYEFIYFQF